MRVIIETIPHNQQRYETVGDWTIDPETGDWTIRVSDTGNDLTNKLVALHEFTEMILCGHNGVTAEMVDEFDMQYEKEREEGLHDEFEEPGFAPGCPYLKEHTTATAVEMQVCAVAGMSWKEHEDNINRL